MPVEEMTKPPEGDQTEDGENENPDPDKDLPLCFVEDRHLEEIEGAETISQTWRMKERMKTVSVALVLCLNVGVDPPDVVKTQPCARLECWTDPISLPSNKALDQIGANLHMQYERWQMRARYKLSLDPTAEEVKKLCTSLRRNAKEERVLFHYNGHGVPKPTYNGEIWVFNRTFTQYIPLSIYDLQAWMGAPSIYVYDCSNAGIILESFEQFADQHQKEYEQAMAQTQLPSTATPPAYDKCIQLGACGAKQSLPMNPNLPADLFTSCLTTPIRVSMKWFALKSTSKLIPASTLELLDRHALPGVPTDRRTMWGQLNWIFTAITDTIAWNTLRKDLFQRLFRQDLLVASLFRNYLLAERIMKSCDCTPVSSPVLPNTCHHPMWHSWDLSLNLSLSQLPGMILKNEPFQPLPFFEEQLTAFHIWLELGSEDRRPPETLPIVLQVLLSQSHRMRALDLLARFVDLGPWAVNLSLSVGIFPYVLKLLQANAKECRSLLVFIWAKIVAVDTTCQADLARDICQRNFLSILQDSNLPAESRAQAAFVVASIVNSSTEARETALQNAMVTIFLECLIDPHPLLRQWLAIGLGNVWDNYERARWTGVRDIAHERLSVLLADPHPEVRAAGVYALGTLMNSVNQRSEHSNNIDHAIATTLLKHVTSEVSHMVRMETVRAMQWVVLAFEQVFLGVCMKDLHTGSPLSQESVNITSPGMRRIGSRDRLRISEDHIDKIKRVSSSSSINTIMNTSGGGGVVSTKSSGLSHTGSLGTLPGLGYGSVYLKIWRNFMLLESDPCPEVANMCSTVVNHINALVKEHLGNAVENKMNASLSLPPSPNRGSYLSSESPPIEMSKFRTPSRKISPNPIIEESEDKVKTRTPLVTTKFVEWAAKKFTLPMLKNKTPVDLESPAFYEKDWRIKRNSNVRREALEEQSRIPGAKLESQVFNTRTSLPPSVLQFHPFDQQIVVAGKDHFGIWDWGTGAKTTVCHNKSAKFITSKITALEWINAHDLAMLMVASDDGSLKVWKPNTGYSREPTLITAWQCLPELKWKYSGVVLAWEQYTMTAIAAGDCRVIRFWDVEREFFAFDIPTLVDSSVTCVDSTFAGLHNEDMQRSAFDYEMGDRGIYVGGGDAPPTAAGGSSQRGCGLVTCGFADGSVRVYDRRCGPSEARVALFEDHGGSVLGLRMLRNTLIYSGSSDGYVNEFDIRNHKVLNSTRAIQNNMSCFTIHTGSRTYACGSLNQNVSIYSLEGNALNTIKFYEGFMGHRTGPVTCLNYHPLKVALATGTSDCSVSVYCLEGKR